MRCKGNFRNDRICDLCRLNDHNYYNECIVEHEKGKVQDKIFLDIFLKCEYKYQDWDEYTPYDMCKRLKDSCSVYQCPKLKGENNED